jgi:hypothetical protein
METVNSGYLCRIVYFNLLEDRQYADQRSEAEWLSMANCARYGKCFSILSLIDVLPHQPEGMAKNNGNSVGFKTTRHCHNGNDDCRHVYDQFKCIAHAEAPVAALLGGRASRRGSLNCGMLVAQSEAGGMTAQVPILSASPLRIG